MYILLPLIIILFVLIALQACLQQHRKQTVQELKEDVSDVKHTLAAIDKDGDGVISAAEAADFARRVMDRDGDGQVSAAEALAFAEGGKAAHTSGTRDGAMKTVRVEMGEVNRA